LAQSLKGFNFEVRDIIDENIKKTIQNYDTDIMPEEVDAEKMTLAIKEIMWQDVGIIRNKEGLNRALASILKIEEKFPYCDKCPDSKTYELRNMIEIAKLVISSALERKHSLGSHFMNDEVNEVENNGEIAASKIYD